MPYVRCHLPDVRCLMSDVICRMSEMLDIKMCLLEICFRLLEVSVSERCPSEKCPLWIILHYSQISDKELSYSKEIPSFRTLRTFLLWRDVTLGEVSV